jgi:hypothetical protein
VTDPAVRVFDVPAEERYAAEVDGRRAGFTQYRLRDGTISFLHTEVDPPFAGRGVGGRLIRGALDDAGRRDLAVLPFCPFVNAFIKDHREYVGLVPEARRPRFGL